MKNHLAHPSSAGWRLTLIMLNGALLFAVMGFSPPSQRSSNDASTAICYAVFIPLWILAIWYWYRHYKVRGQNGALAASAAFIFSGLAIMAMIVDAPLRAIFSKAKFGPCPHCGKTKLIRENPSQGDHVAQPQCPHCKTLVGPAAIGGAPLSVNIPKQIEELQQLQDKNLITHEEFEKKKAELLSRM